MAIMNIKPGDQVEVEKDTGAITNAPWCNVVTRVEGALVYFDEGSGYEAGYTFEIGNLKRHSHDNSQTKWVFEK